MLLHQLPTLPGGRQISAIDVSAGGSTQSVDLMTASIDGSGQAVVLDTASNGTIDIVITAVTPGDPAQAASRAGVGSVEVDTGLGATTEFIRPPVDSLQQLPASHGPLDIVFTRERVDATSFWRSDPEPVLRRLFPLTSGDSFDVDVTVRLDERATDTQLAAILGDEGAVADRRLPGVAHRGSAAVDGDPATAWLTPIDESVGATLTVTSTSEPLTALDLVQPSGAWSTISQIVIAGPGGAATIEVPAPDSGGRTSVPLPAGLVPAGESFSLTISQIQPLTLAERRYGDTITMPAGISELTGTAGITPTAAASDQPVSQSCGSVFLAVDDALLPVEFSATAGDLLAGQPLSATSCTGPVALAAGEHTIVDQAAGTGFTIDRVVLSTTGQRSPAASPEQAANVSVTDQSTLHRTAEVDCPAGCWLVFGMGHNTAWSAAGPSGDLGEPALVDGGFNGWWIEPTTGRETVTVTWTAQRLVTTGIVISLLAILACCALLIAARVRLRASIEGPDEPSPPLPAPAASRFGASGKLILFAGAVAVAVAPLSGVVVLAAGLGELLTRRWYRPIPVMAISGLAAVMYVAVSVAVIERRENPFPNAGWTMIFVHLNGVALTAVALVAASTLLAASTSRSSPVPEPRQ